MMMKYNIILLIQVLSAFSGNLLDVYDQMIQDGIRNPEEAREELRGYVPESLLRSKVLYYLEYKDHQEYQTWISSQDNRGEVFREDKN